ncbi:nuclear transport factor 2 family protein [Spirosoma areae]
MKELTQIQQAEQQLMQAQLAGDADTLDTLLADELLFAGPDGNLYTKAMDLAAHRSRTMYLTALGAQKPLIQLLPSLAVVSVLVDLQGVFAGQPMGGRFRYLRVWAYRQGTWQIIAGSCTQVPG